MSYSSGHMIHLLQISLPFKPLRKEMRLLREEFYEMLLSRALLWRLTVPGLSALTFLIHSKCLLIIFTSCAMLWAIVVSTFVFLTCKVVNCLHLIFNGLYCCKHFVGFSVCRRKTFIQFHYEIVWMLWKRVNILILLNIFC